MNWRRAKLARTPCAMADTARDFARPGTPSSRMCPPLRRPSTRLRVSPAWPTRTEDMAAVSSPAHWLASAISASRAAGSIWGSVTSWRCVAVESMRGARRRAAAGRAEHETRRSRGPSTAEGRICWRGPGSSQRSGEERVRTAFGPALRRLRGASARGSDPGRAGPAGRRRAPPWCARPGGHVPPPRAPRPRSCRPARSSGRAGRARRCRRPAPPRRPTPRCDRSASAGAPRPRRTLSPSSSSSAASSSSSDSGKLDPRSPARVAARGGDELHHPQRTRAGPLPTHAAALREDDAGDQRGLHPRLRRGRLDDVAQAVDPVERAGVERTAQDRLERAPRRRKRGPRAPRGRRPSARAVRPPRRRRTPAPGTCRVAGARRCLSARLDRVADSAAPRRAAPRDKRPWSHSSLARSSAGTRPMGSPISRSSSRRARSRSGPHVELGEERHQELARLGRSRPSKAARSGARRRRRSRAATNHANASRCSASSQNR